MKFDFYLAYLRSMYRRSEYPNVHIDTYGYCNAKCIFCGYHNMKRPKGKISNDLLYKILLDISSWPEPMKEIVPIHYGEFFLNPNWFEILQKIEMLLPNTKIAIPTNGSNLTADMIFKLLTIKTLKYIGFSIYGFFDESYERLMGLKPMTPKLIDFSNIIKRERPDIAINIGSTDQPPFLNEYEGEFLKQFCDVPDSCYHAHAITSNKQINPELQRTYPYPVPCLEILTNLMIMWDGKVCMCCSDPDGEILVGDVTKQSLLEIWNGDKVRGYQELHLNGKRDDIPLCKTCTCSVFPQEE